MNKLINKLIDKINDSSIVKQIDKQHIYTASLEYCVDVTFFFIFYRMKLEKWLQSGTKPDETE